MGDWIVADPEILGGKPCIKGTRISVELILELLASGASREEILRAYPQISPEGLAAALQYAAKTMRVQLADELWESVAKDSAALPLTAAQSAEIDRRLEACRKNPDAALPWREALETRSRKAAHDATAAPVAGGPSRYPAGQGLV